MTNVLLSLVVVNLWEEMVWAGFVQRRATVRWGYLAGSVVTALLFTGIGMRLLIGAFDVWGRGSILALALIHATFNASSELVEADADWVRYVVTFALGLTAAGFLRATR